MIQTIAKKALSIAESEAGDADVSSQVGESDLQAIQELRRLYRKMGEELGKAIIGQTFSLNQACMTFYASFICRQ